MAVLVAIAIPIFTTQLAKSRAATDLANIRSGYAAVTSEILVDPPSADTTYGLNADGTATKGAAGDYACKGASGDADSTSNIGSLKVGSDITWAKDDPITYTVTIDTTSGIASVTGISGS